MSRNYVKPMVIFFNLRFKKNIFKNYIIKPKREIDQSKMSSLF